VAWARTMREHGVPALQLLWKKVQSWLVSFSSKNLISIMINMKTKVYVLALYTILIGFGHGGAPHVQIR
jgi:hypothetical protein